jgi:hypothetical protein
MSEPLELEGDTPEDQERWQVRSQLEDWVEIPMLSPAFRVLRVLRVLRLGRGMRLVRLVGTANRGLRALRTSFSRRGLGYVLASTALVILLGAGDMLAIFTLGCKRGRLTTALA